MKDEELLSWYMKGFNDELDGKSSSISIDNIELKLKAYNLGALHAILGDELSHIDKLNNEEILEMIKED